MRLFFLEPGWEPNCELNLDTKKFRRRPRQLSNVIGDAQAKIASTTWAIDLGCNLVAVLPRPPYCSHDWEYH